MASIKYSLTNVNIVFLCLYLTGVNDVEEYEEKAEVEEEEVEKEDNVEETQVKEETEDTDASTMPKFYFDCCNGKQGFVAIGDIVLYLGQLTCIILSIYRTGGILQATCQGLDKEKMELDETCQLTCSPLKLTLANFKLNSKLKSQIRKIKSKALVKFHTSQQKHKNQLSYTNELSRNQSLIGIYKKIQELLSKTSIKSRFEIPSTLFLRRQFKLRSKKNNYCFKYNIEEQDRSFNLEDIFGKFWDVKIIENDDRCFFTFIRYMKINLVHKQTEILNISLEKCTSTNSFDPNNYKQIAIQSLTKFE